MTSKSFRLSASMPKRFAHPHPYERKDDFLKNSAVASVSIVDCTSYLFCMITRRIAVADRRLLLSVAVGVELYRQQQDPNAGNSRVDAGVVIITNAETQLCRVI